MDFKDNTLLILSLKKGNKKAFSYLIDTYHHSLCVYANSLINNHIQADDVVQNVFVKLWEKRKSINESYSLKSFLYKAVYNEFIDQYRKTQSVLRIEKVYVDYINTIIDSGSEEDNEKLISLVNDSIQQLPPKCKQIFELSKSEGLSNIEISEYLNVSIKTVEFHITNAFSIIRKKIKNKTSAVFFMFFDFKKYNFLKHLV
ncbi:RNA polymerase sigma-70 factor [Polaribacter staleyi]|uniref:RNA polymerase sigma-70 factor n=1 Tax=Polaribacter staleyi TaxID=2022337 RepID=UPI0031B9AE68